MQHDREPGQMTPMQSDDQPTGTLRAVRAGQPPPEIAWRPAASAGVQVGAALCGALALLTLIGVLLAGTQSGGLRVAALLLALLAGAATTVVGVLLRALLILRYHLGAQGLEADWLGRRVHIPWQDVQDAEWQGDTREGIPALPATRQRWEPWWPGYTVRHTQHAGQQHVTLATLGAGRRVVLLHTHGTLVISPERPVRFLAEVALRVAHALEGGAAAPVSPTAGPAPLDAATSAAALVPSGGPAEVAHTAASMSPIVTPDAAPAAASPMTQPSPMTPGGFWHDLRHGFTALGQERTGSILLSVLGGLPILLGMVLYSRLDVLPERIALHWDADGQPDRYGGERSLWLLPLGALAVAALAILAASWSVLRDRVSALTLLWLGVLVQVALAIALLRLT